MERRWPRITLQHILMAMSVVCIWAAHIWIMNHFAQSPFSDLTDVPRLAEKKFEPIETKVLGAVEFIIICAAIAFRRCGRVAAWSAIGAAFVATLIASLVATLRYSN